ncbi:MAG: TIGR02757 family protein, partial [Proteobacteria bacterium]|nr:TIGR02757 family protein [Pseudomonadota bacterium]
MKNGPSIDKTRLELLYSRYNHRDFVHPDPIEFLYDFKELHDREIVALIASSLAYGRVTQILKSVSRVLQRMGPSPHRFLLNTPWDRLQSSFSRFRHRFTSGEELSSLLGGAKRAIERYGSLRQCFLAGYQDQDETVLPALSAFVRALDFENNGRLRTYIPSPDRGSACKRLNLFLRWMVREDEVDPGGWRLVPVSKLVVPLDTHMHRIGLMLNLTKRRQPDMRAAMEMTAAFRCMAPEDPVRYDFVLTRFGIRNDLDRAAL